MFPHLSQNTLGFIKWNQAGKGTLTGALCQQIRGTATAEQKPATMGGRKVPRFIRNLGIIEG
jgi:hypothetical protein